MRSLFVVCATLIASVALAADKYDPPGSIVELQVFHSTADTYLQYHGRIVVQSGSELVGYLETEYRWGGTSCSNKILPDAMVDRLERAQLAGATITPYWVSGQGINQCLVGFTIE